MLKYLKPYIKASTTVLLKLWGETTSPPPQAANQTKCACQCVNALELVFCSSTQSVTRCLLRPDKDQTYFVPQNGCQPVGDCAVDLWLLRPFKSNTTHLL